MDLHRSCSQRGAAQAACKATPAACCAGSPDPNRLPAHRPAYAAPLPMDEQLRQDTVACIVGGAGDFEDDPVLESLCQLIRRLLRVALAGELEAPGSGSQAQSARGGTA